MPGAGGPDAAADPEQRGRPVGAGEHDQAPVRSELAHLAGSTAAGPVSGLPPEETEEVLQHLHVQGIEFPSA